MENNKANYRELIKREIEKLVDQGNIDEARNLLANYPDNSLDNDSIKWKHKLSLPRPHTHNKTTKENIKNHEWLKNNVNKYTKEWVALKNGKLLGHNPNRIKLRKQLSVIELKDALFVKRNWNA